MSFTAAALLRDKYAPDSTATWIRPAGITTAFNETVKDAVTWQEPPPTPPDQKKYRQSTLHEPGKVVKHPGMADDSEPQGPFGDKTRSMKGESVAEYMKNFPDSELARWHLVQAEDIYARCGICSYAMWGRPVPVVVLIAQN